MYKNQVKKIEINLNKIFLSKIPQKNIRGHISKNKAAVINIDGATKKATPQKPSTPKILDLKTHLFSNNHSTLSTAIFSKKELVQNVV